MMSRHQPLSPPETFADMRALANGPPSEAAWARDLRCDHALAGKARSATRRAPLLGGRAASAGPSPSAMPPHVWIQNMVGRPDPVDGETLIKSCSLSGVWVGAQEARAIASRPLRQLRRPEHPPATT